MAHFPLLTGGPHFLGSNAHVPKSAVTLLDVRTNRCFHCYRFLGQHLQARALSAIVLLFVAEQSLELSKLLSHVLGYMWVFGDTRVSSSLALSLRGFELALPVHGLPFHSGTSRGVRGCGMSTGEYRRRIRPEGCRTGAALLSLKVPREASSLKLFREQVNPQKSSQDSRCGNPTQR